MRSCVGDVRSAPRLAPQWSAYSSPVDPAQYQTIAVVLMLLGFASTAFFFVGTSKTVRAPGGSEAGAVAATRTVVQRSLVLELVSALAASVFLGFGVLFVALSAGIYA